MAVEITDSNIDTFLMEDKPLVIDFGAEWCAPCRILASIIEELAEEYPNGALPAGYWLLSSKNWPKSIKTVST